MFKLTRGQRIDLVGISKEDLPKVWADLDMPSGWAYGKSYRTCKSCIGTDHCRFGLGDSMGLAKKSEAEFRGLDSPGQLKLATAGCPRNCSEAMVKDIGAITIGNDKWEIYVGGAAGRSPAASSSGIVRAPSTRNAPTPSSSASASNACGQWWRKRGSGSSEPKLHFRA